MRRAWIAVGLAAMGLARMATARDLEEILRQKGILTAEEAKEAQAAVAVPAAAVPRAAPAAPATAPSGSPGSPRSATCGCATRASFATAIRTAFASGFACVSEPTCARTTRRRSASGRSDGAVFAFQGIAELALAPGVSATLAAGDFKFHKASTIATARNGNSSLLTTNNVRLSDGSVVGGRNFDPAKAGPNQDGLDADGKPIRITGFVSDFNEVNAGGELTLETPLPRYPLRLFGDGVSNTEAAGGDDAGFQVGASIGGGDRRGDLSFRYAYERLETDAEVSAFADSDFGDGGTDQKGHVLQLTYGVLDNVQLLSTALLTEPIDAVAGRNPNTLVRWQVDLLARF